MDMCTARVLSGTGTSSQVTPSSFEISTDDVSRSPVQAPTGGFVQFQFADSAPRVSWSVLDHERRPKLGLGALALACAPVIVVADRLPAAVRPGDAFALDVHVVSDLRRPLADLTCSATLSWPGGAHRWRFAGSVPPDACARIGTLQIELPTDVVAGGDELVLDLEVRGTDLPGGAVTNRDSTTVAR